MGHVLLGRIGAEEARFTADLDASVKSREVVDTGTKGEVRRFSSSALLTPLLNAAVHEAESAHCGFVGEEHLLVAGVCESNALLDSLFHRHRLSLDAARAALKSLRDGSNE